MIRARTRSNALVEIYRTAANFPRLSGYAPSNYCASLGNLYQKKQVNSLILKTQPVQCMNIRANKENKRFVRDLMKLMEARNGLPKTNYGGWKGVSFPMKAANRVIIFDLFRQELRSGSLCIADKNSAHDLVVHSIASLQCIRRGADPGRTALTLSTLRNLATTIKMEGADVSETPYQSER